MDEPSAWTVGPCGLDLLDFKEFSEILYHCCPYKLWAGAKPFMAPVKRL